MRDHDISNGGLRDGHKAHRMQHKFIKFDEGLYIFLIKCPIRYKSHYQSPRTIDVFLWSVNSNSRNLKLSSCPLVFGATSSGFTNCVQLMSG